MHIVTCVDCGSEVLTRRSNTKYCRFHRFKRDLMYVRGIDATTKKCMACDQKFIPSHNKQSICSTCIDNASAPKDTCARCKTENVRMIAQDVRVCTKCAESPDEGRQKYLLTQLLKKDKALKEHPVKGLVLPLSPAEQLAVADEEARKLLPLEEPVI